MIEVSCRENFTSTTNFSHRIVSHSPYPENKNVLIAIHGFNAEIEKVRKRYRQLEKQMEDLKAFDELVGFFWPGSWTQAVGFINADKRAGESGKYLANLIFELMVRKNTITIEAHSLGCKVCLFASKSLPVESISRWIFFAPAVPNDILKDYESFFTSSKNTPRIFFSRGDKVLKYAYRLVPYNWFKPALGYSGPKPENEEIAIDLTGLVNDHSGYMNFAIDLCI